VKLGNQTTSTSKVRRVGFGDCGPSICTRGFPCSPAGGPETRAPSRPLPVLGEGVLPEELMLDVQPQVADLALHTESVVIVQ